MRRRGITEWLSLVARGMIKTGGFLAAYVCLSVMIGLMALDPVMRYLAGSPFFWSNEVTTYLMILMVFNGFGRALLASKHIRVTLIFNRLPGKVQNVLWVIICLAGLFYVGFVTYAIVLLMLSSFTLGVRSEVTNILMFPWQIMVICGLIVFLVAMIVLTVRSVAVALGRSQEETTMLGKPIEY